MGDSDDYEHWVEKLFPPHFTFNHEQLIQPIEELRTGIDLALSSIDYDDSESIRNVYERVLILVQEMSAAKREKLLPARNQAEKRMGAKLKTISTQTEKIQKDQTELWTGEEIALLREDFRLKNSASLALRADLKATRENLSDVTVKLEQLQAERQQMSDEFNTEKSYSRNLKILSDNLRQHLRSTRSRLQSVETERQNAVAQRDDALRSVAALSRELELEKVDYKLTQTQLDKIQNTMQEDLDREKTTLKVTYELEVSELVDRINRLTTALDEEQGLHKKCKLGLDHLRRHYSQSPALIKDSDIKITSTNQK